MSYHQQPSLDTLNLQGGHGLSTFMSVTSLEAGRLPRGVFILTHIQRWNDHDTKCQEHEWEEPEGDNHAKLQPGSCPSPYTPKICILPIIVFSASTSSHSNLSSHSASHSHPALSDSPTTISQWGFYIDMPLKLGRGSMTLTRIWLVSEGLFQFCLILPWQYHLAL